MVIQEPIVARTSQRFVALDGLRGIAALIVVAHHVLLTSPRIQHAAEAGIDTSARGISWALTYTPLHIFWSGGGAVNIFFVLSGFVLTLPFLRTKRPRWRSYYPKRLIRLYIPVWASLVFALILSLIVPRQSLAEFTYWVQAHAAAPTVLHDAYLLNGANWLNSPLWSLRWEVLFSLLLPVFILLAIEFKRYWLWGIAGCLVIVGFSLYSGNQYALYLPAFGMGVLMAAGKDTLQKWAGKLNLVAWIVLVVGALLLFPATWYVPGKYLLLLVELVACMLLVFVCLYFRPAIRFASITPIQWLGKRSFSLYLVHEPIILTVVNAFHLTNPLLVGAIAIPASLVMAEIFYWAVEKPSHRLANLVGRRLERTTAQASNSVTPAAPAALDTTSTT